MKAGIILGLGILSHTVVAQQQQQRLQVNNVSNVIYQTRGSLGNSNQMSNVNVQVLINNANRPKITQRVKRNTTANFTQVKASSATNKTSQVARRRPRQRVAIAPTIAVTEPVPVTVQIDDPPAQNFVLANNDAQPSINQVSEVNGNSFIQASGANEINTVNDFSMNLQKRVAIRSSSSSSASHKKNFTFSNKMAKLKRNFFGKLAHKKSKHRLDVCFSWKK